MQLWLRLKIFSALFEGKLLHFYRPNPFNSPKGQSHTILWFMCHIISIQVYSVSGAFVCWSTFISHGNSNHSFINSRNVITTWSRECICFQGTKPKYFPVLVMDSSLLRYSFNHVNLLKLCIRFTQPLHNYGFFPIAISNWTFHLSHTWKLEH